jgi:hypothetical protein
MSSKAVQDIRKRKGFTAVAARSLPRQRSFEFPGTVGSEQASAATGHDFGRLAVVAQPIASGNCPLSLASPRACPFGGTCHTCPALVRTKTAAGPGLAPSTRPAENPNAAVSTIVIDGNETEFVTANSSDSSMFHTQAPTAPGPAPGPAPAPGGGGGSTTNYCSPTGRFTSIPSGTLTATFGSGKFGARFNMKADFDTPIPCTCVCGEYRQFVRGYAKSNGTSVVHRLCSNTMSPTIWYEDCLTSGGTNLKYGYHSIAFATSKFTNPDQATGCTFEGFDYPGFPLSGVSSGDKLEMHLEFIGKLVDACDSDKELTSSSWTVEGSGTVP